MLNMDRVADTDQLTQIIKTGTPAACVKFLAPLAPNERAAFGKTAMTLFMEWDKAHEAALADGRPRTEVRPDVARVAVLCTASLSQVKSCGWNICLTPALMLEAFAQVRPDWLDDWVTFMLEDSPFNLHRVRNLWENGLYAKPDSAAYVLALFVAPRNMHWPGPVTAHAKMHWKDLKPLAERLQAQSDVIPDPWRLFDVEGNGEFSLAAYDKYSGPDQSWARTLQTLSEQGLMARERVLDATLYVLMRDFAQFRAGCRQTRRF